MQLGCPRNSGDTEFRGIFWLLKRFLLNSGEIPRNSAEFRGISPELRRKSLPYSAECQSVTSVDTLHATLMLSAIEWPPDLYTFLLSGSQSQTNWTKEHNTDENMTLRSYPGPLLLVKHYVKSPYWAVLLSLYSIPVCKYQHDWLYIQSINSNKHLLQSSFKGQFF